MSSIAEFFGSSGLGHCDHPAPLTDFQGDKYMGMWYGQQHTKGLSYIDDSDVCSQAYYSDLQADGHFVVNNTGQSEGFGERHGVIGTGYCPDETGQCIVKFGDYPTPVPNYKIVMTDYTSYSVIYACDLVKPTVFLLSREPVIDMSLYELMISIV